MGKAGARARKVFYHPSPEVARAMVMKRIANRGQTAKKTAGYTVVDGRAVLIEKPVVVECEGGKVVFPA